LLPPHVTEALLAGFAILFLMFALNVVIRTPHLNKPLYSAQDQYPCKMLITQQIWYEEGALKHRFSPVMNYGGKVNKISSMR